MAVPTQVNGLTNALRQVAVGRTGLWSIQIYNAAAAVSYVQCFDVMQSNSVTLGTTPPNWQIAVPATQSVTIAPAQSVNFLNGLFLAASTTAGGAAAPASALDVSLVI